MGRLKEFLSEDSNQYGPGTDLMISLAAIFLVIIFINGFVNKQAIEKAGEDHFNVVQYSFEAAGFKKMPFWEFQDERDAREKIKVIAGEYEKLKARYPYIFVIGHASDIDAPNPLDHSEPARWERNWNFAGERAALVSRFLQQELRPEDRDKLVVVSAGEFDTKEPDPSADANALVRVVFGNEWLPQTNRVSKNQRSN